MGTANPIQYGSPPADLAPLGLAAYPSQYPSDYASPSDVSPLLSNSSSGLDAFFASQANKNNALAATTLQQNTEAANTAANLKTYSPYLTGLQAGESVDAGTDTTANVAGVLGATASGAIGGAMVGGPWGALAGGAVGLISGGLNAYFGEASARKKKRAQDLLNQQILARQKVADDQKQANFEAQLGLDQKQLDTGNFFKSQELAQNQSQFTAGLAATQENNNYNRAATAETQRYSRKTAALQAQWAAIQAAGAKVTQDINNNQALRDIFLKQARQ